LNKTIENLENPGWTSLKPLYTVESNELETTILSLKRNVRRLVHAMMVDRVISGLLLASVSGVTFIAYKHPKSFARLYWFLMPASTVIFASAIAHNIGFYEAQTLMIDFIPKPIDWPRVLAAMDGKTFHYYWMIYSQVAVWIYFTILFYLPLILKGRPSRASKEAR